MTFRRWNIRPLTLVGRAALLGLATLLVPMTSVMAQGALDPDREDSKSDGDQDRREVVDLSEIEFTAGPRHKGESDRDRTEHKGRRGEGHQDAKPDSKHSEAHPGPHHRGGDGEHHADRGHESKHEGEHASHHHRGGHGEHHGWKGHESKHEGEHASHHRGEDGEHHACKCHESKHEGEHASHHRDGDGEHHASKCHESKHECEHASHDQDGHGEHHADRGKAEHRGPKDEKPVHHLVKGSQNDGHHEAESKKGGGSKGKSDEKPRKSAAVESKQEANTVEGEIALAKSDVVRAHDRLAWSTRMEKKGYLFDSSRVADELNLRKARFNLEQAQTKKDVLEKYGKENAVKDGRKGSSDASKGHADVNARVDTIEKKLDELIRVVHELKGHDSDAGKENRRK